jgi:molybdate transport system substrate-binding protein
MNFIGNRQTRKSSLFLPVFLVLGFLSISDNVTAETIKVAVASNFARTLALLAEDFKSYSGHDIQLISGSTGKLYMQIKHGAPFDVFMSADERRPELLVSESYAEDATAHVYARGRLVLVSNIKPFGDCQTVLRSGQLKHLSIANPKIAPYGYAAKQVLSDLSLWNELQAKLVMGENVAQAMHFVSTENAQAGLVARSMLAVTTHDSFHCEWIVPARMHDPISQKMVVLKKAQQRQAAMAFLSYMKTGRAKQIIEQAGYDI